MEVVIHGNDQIEAQYEPLLGGYPIEIFGRPDGKTEATRQIAVVVVPDGSRMIRSDISNQLYLLMPGDEPGQGKGISAEQLLSLARNEERGVRFSGRDQT